MKILTLSFVLFFAFQVKEYSGKIIHVIDGVNINLLSVQNGYAWHYKKYSSNKALAEAEEKARAAKKGLWAEPTPMEPWEWRKLNK